MESAANEPVDDDVAARATLNFLHLVPTYRPAVNDMPLTASELVRIRAMLDKVDDMEAANRRLMAPGGCPVMRSVLRDD